MRTPYSKLS
jgi:hypothetical protein